MKVSFTVIGNKWGNKIFNILKESNYFVKKLNLRSPERYKNRNEYFKELNKQLILTKKKHNIIWLAISPKKKDQFEIIRYCLNKKFNLILEKPWVVSKKNTQILEKIQKKKNVLVGFNFEYLYLNFFKKKIFLKEKIKKIIFNFHVKNRELKKNHKFELGTHLNAIKYCYFSNVKNYKINTGYKKNLRKINIKFSKRSLVCDFTKNKEKIIQNFVIDFCNHLKNKQKDFKYNFKFALLSK